jgi:AcrR family transcriptional regulator
VTSEILAVARAHLARDGAAALSLRSIARELEMAPSALYRYFSGRDALLSALILAAYESLADEAERASAAVFARDGRDAERWLAVPRAMRTWALGHPHEWSLIFGTPVPGYHAPEDTVVPYARLAGALVRPVVEAKRAGRLKMDVLPTEISDALGQAVAPVADALFPGMPAPKVVVALQAWTTLVGVISLELFGHWRHTILEPELFFEETISNVAVSVGLI